MAFRNLVADQSMPKHTVSLENRPTSNFFSNIFWFMAFRNLVADQSMPKHTVSLENRPMSNFFFHSDKISLTQ